MDKNEQILKVEELKDAMRGRDFEKAVEIADTFDVRKVKDNNLLSLMADAYELTHDYQKAKKILLIAYENTNAGRHLAYRLCLVSTKMKDFAEAKEFYEDFVEMAPRDTARYILKYKMAKAQGKSVEELIQILEEYINIDMEEKWAYELAKLYHIQGNDKKCVALCDEISLWFAEGKYVSKAMELKKNYEELTPSQKQKYEEGLAQVEDIREPDEEKSQEPIEDNADPREMTEISFSDVAAQDEEKTKKIFEKKSDEDTIEEFEEEEMFDDIQEEEIEDNIEDDILEEVEPDIADNPIHDIHDVENILKQLQERGILKAETVQQAVNIIDEAGKETESREENGGEILEDNISAFDRWEEDKTPTEELDMSKEKISAVSGETKVIPDVKLEKNPDDEKIEMEQIQADPQRMAVKPKNEDVNTPVLDLSFDTPQRDTSNDIGKENMYESIVTNSELGKITDQLPTKEEIDAAIRNAQLHVQENSSTKVEILSGIDDMVTEDRNATVSMSKEEPVLENDDSAIEDTPMEQEKTTLEDTAKIEDSSKSENETEEVKTVHEEHIKEPGMVLTDQDLAPFKNYLNVEGLETNLRKIAYDLVNNYKPNGKSEDGNIIIMGNEKTGKTTLAIEIIKLVNKKRGRRGRKLAKINATALNRRGFRNSLHKLIGSDLIIEDAHKLGAMTMSEIVDATGMFTDDMLIVLEGDTQGMEHIMESSTRISKAFNHVIQIREYDIKEWVEYGKRYALEKGYGVDELANLAFYKAIDDFFGKNKGIGQKDVQSIVDRAIARSRKLGRKVKGIFSSKKDENGLIILMESDFNI